MSAFADYQKVSLGNKPAGDRSEHGVLRDPDVIKAELDALPRWKELLGTALHFFSFLVGVVLMFGYTGILIEVLGDFKDSMLTNTPADMVIMLPLTLTSIASQFFILILGTSATWKLLKPLTVPLLKPSMDLRKELKAALTAQGDARRTRAYSIART